MKDVCLALKNVNGFGQTSANNKIVVMGALIKHAPLKDCDNLLAFLDMLRIGCLDEEVNVFISESIYDLLIALLETYFINKFTLETQNPKNVRIMIWRLIANISKFEAGSLMLFSIYDQLLVAAQESLTTLKENDAMVKSMSMAINNLIFAEYGLECDEDGKYELFRAFSQNLSCPTENTVIATLNVLCRLSKDNKEMIARIKKEDPSLIVRLGGLKSSQNEVIQMFAEDLLYILK